MPLPWLLLMLLPPSCYDNDLLLLFLLVLLLALRLPLSQLPLMLLLLLHYYHTAGATTAIVQHVGDCAGYTCPSAVPQHPGRILGRGSSIHTTHKHCQSNRAPNTSWYVCALGTAQTRDNHRMRSCLMQA